jgi:hypothetical protein
MSTDSARLAVGVEFFCLAKYAGDRDPRDELPDIPDEPDELRKLCRRLQGELYGLRADLTDPKTEEIRAGGDGLPTATWRRVWA